MAVADEPRLPAARLAHVARLVLLHQLDTPPRAGEPVGDGHPEDAGPDDDGRVPPVGSLRLHGHDHTGPVSETRVEVAGREVRISSPDKILFPEQGWTKLDLVEHYLMCVEGALRGVRDRPTMHPSCRCRATTMRCV